MSFHAQKMSRVKVFDGRRPAAAALLLATLLLAGCGKRPSQVEAPPNVPSVSYAYPAPEPMPPSLEPLQTKAAP